MFVLGVRAIDMTHEHRSRSGAMNCNHNCSVYTESIDVVDYTGHAWLDGMSISSVNVPVRAVA